MKSWWQSKAVWVNLASMVMALTALPQVVEYVSAQTLLTANAIINIVLRVWFSNTPISAVGKPDDPRDL